MARTLAYFSTFIFCMWLSACVSTLPEKASFNKNDANQARLELALGYLNGRNFTQAKRNLDKALAYAPKNANTLAVYAYFYQLQGNEREAESFYQQAIKQDDKSGEIKNNYAIFLCEIGKYEQAFQQFELAFTRPYYYHQKDTFENIILCAKRANDDARVKKYRQLLARIRQ